MADDSLVPFKPGAAVVWRDELTGAKALFDSGLCPKALRTPNAVMYVVLAGRELGLGPVQSLRSLYLVDGKISLAADLQLGLFHKRAGCRSKWVELTAESATLELHAPWLLEPHRESFTIRDAMRAGLGGVNWKHYPKAMLRSRCITAGLKSIGFDPTSGVYAPGELPGTPEQSPSELAPIEAEDITDVEYLNESDIVPIPSPPPSNPEE